MEVVLPLAGPPEKPPSIATIESTALRDREEETCIEDRARHSAGALRSSGVFFPSGSLGPPFRHAGCQLIKEFVDALVDLLVEFGVGLDAPDLTQAVGVVLAAL